MKKIIIISLLIFSAILGVSISIYFNAVEPVRAAEKDAIKRAMEETRLVKAEEFQLYHGLETYYVVKGINRYGTSIYVWIPEKEGDIIVRKVTDGVSRKQVVNMLKKEKNPKEIISVRLGVEKNIPLWEIYYMTEGNLINYYYVDFKTGEWLKKIENL